MRGVLPPQPPDLVDLLLDLETLEIVELGLVGLEGGVDVVLPAAGQRRLGVGVPLEDDDAAPLVARGEQVAVMVELHAGYYVRLGHVIVQRALDLREAPLDIAIAWGITGYLIHFLLVRFIF